MTHNIIFQNLRAKDYDGHSGFVSHFAHAFSMIKQYAVHKQLQNAVKNCVDYAKMTSNFDLEQACLTVIFNNRYFWE